MNKVQPIRDRARTHQMIERAKKHDMQHGGELSWELLLLVGFNTGLRISDILELTVGDIQRGAEIRPKKTRKRTDAAVPFEMRYEVKERVKVLLCGRDPAEMAFPSRQRRGGSDEKQAITRQRAYQIVKGLARVCGVKEAVGTHTLRKTYAYHAYQQKKDVEALRQLLGQKNEQSTLHYIGITEDNLRSFQRTLEPFI